MTDQHFALFETEIGLCAIAWGSRGINGTQLPMGGEEKIRYGMPAVMFADRYGIHFAGWKKHVGLYPVGELDPDLEAEIAPHRATKDTVQFFYEDPVPYDLIERVARALAAGHTG